MLSMHIVGGDELARAFGQVDAALRSEALEAAVLPEGEAVADAARTMAPRRTGRMAASIHAEVAELDDQHIDVLVGPDDKHFYALFREFGTEPHEQGAGINPGGLARPFLRPALDARAETAVGNIGRVLGERVESRAVA